MDELSYLEREAARTRIFEFTDDKAKQQRRRLSAEDVTEIVDESLDWTRRARMRVLLRNNTLLGAVDRTTCAPGSETATNESGSVASIRVDCRPLPEDTYCLESFARLSHRDLIGYARAGKSAEWPPA